MTDSSPQRTPASNSGSDSRIKVTVNGEIQGVETGASLADLIETIGFSGQRIAAEINLEVIPKAGYADRVLQDGDKIEIVSFVGGG